MKKPRIKPPAQQKGKNIQIPEQINYDEKPPIFSLERVQSGNYCFSTLDTESKAHFADSIYKRRSIKWGEIKKIDRHGLGFEKIAKDAIKAPKPPFITEDKDYFLAFRFNGKKPMVGYRLNDIFYVLWFDHNFTLYDHG